MNYSQKCSILKLLDSKNEGFSVEIKYKTWKFITTVEYRRLNIYTCEFYYLIRLSNPKSATRINKKTGEHYILSPTNQEKLQQIECCNLIDLAFKQYY